MVTSIFAGLVFTPLEDVICSRSTMDFTPNLFLFSFIPFLRIFKNTLFKGSLYLPRFLPLTIISSWELALLATNGGNFSFGKLRWLSKFRWVNLLKQERPKGVPKARRCELSSSTFICQHTKETSSFEKKGKHKTFMKIFTQRWGVQGVLLL